MIVLEKNSETHRLLTEAVSHSDFKFHNREFEDGSFAEIGYLEVQDLRFCVFYMADKNNNLKRIITRCLNEDNEEKIKGILTFDIMTKDNDFESLRSLVERGRAAEKENQDK